MTAPTKRAKPRVSPKRREQSRREFLRSAGLTVGMVGASLLGLLPVLGGANARLRPPGALKDRLDEQAFLAAFPDHRQPERLLTPE